MKQYLLLRDNTVSGPHSLTDLIEKDLTQADLVWIENESNCWTAANQVEELKKFVTLVDEEWLLNKRQQLINARQNARMIQQEPGSFTLLHGQQHTGAGIHVRYKAPYFPERIAKEQQTHIWKRPDYPVANWLNVTLVFLTACVVAYVVSQLAG